MTETLRLAWNDTGRYKTQIRCTQKTKPGHLVKYAESDYLSWSFVWTLFKNTPSYSKSSWVSTLSMLYTARDIQFSIRDMAFFRRWNVWWWSSHSGESTSDPPENCQLNVKKLPKIVLFFQQNCKCQFHKVVLLRCFFC